MLLEKLQIQAIADRMVGMNPVYPGVGPLEEKHFSEPWLTLWRAITTVQPDDGQTRSAALLVAAETFADAGDLLEAVLRARPGALEKQFPSLAELAASLPRLEWVWPGWIPRGMITMLGAQPGAGKSFIALDLARRIIEDRGFPDGQPVLRPRRPVIYVDGEFVPQIMNARAVSWEMDTSRLYPLLPGADGMLALNEPADQERLAAMCAGLGPELVVVDSFASVNTNGENKVEDVRPLMAFLNLLAHEFHTGLLLIHHLRKDGNGKLSMADFRGSGHLLAMARSVIGLSIVPTDGAWKPGSDPDPDGPRKVEVVKTNLGPYPVPLGFQMLPLHPEGALLQWGDAPTHQGVVPRPTRLDECREWLATLLRERGERSFAGILELARAEGYSRSIVHQARQQIGSQIDDTAGAYKAGNKWRWAG